MMPSRRVATSCVVQFPRGIHTIFGQNSNCHRKLLNQKAVYGILGRVDPTFIPTYIRQCAA